MPGALLLRLPSSSDPGRLLPVEVSPLTLRDGAEWDARVRPVIRGTDRADRDWRWTLRPFLLALPGRGGFAMRASGQLVGLAHYNGSAHLLTSTQQGAVYLWEISAAPPELAAVRGISRGLLYCVVQESLARGHGGCVALHADPAGGQDLIGMYEHLGMSRVPAGLPAYRWQRNDGRFFELDRDAACGFVEDAAARGMLG